MDKNDEMIKIENRYSDITIKLSELMYLLYWGIMLFCKGMGVYDGQIFIRFF